MGILSTALSLLGATRPTAPASTHDAGMDFHVQSAPLQDYPALDSMSAMAAFPFVFAAVSARAEDLAGLPLRCARGRGPDAVPVVEHPVLTLLSQPSERITGLQLRMQLVADLRLTGNAYVRILTVGGRPVSLLRMHPARVRPVPASDGQPAWYEYDGAGTYYRIPWDQVLHIRGPSWEDGPEGLYGTGAIQSLHQDLVTELAVQKGTQDSANRGRPDAVAIPKNTITPKRAREWSDEINRVFESRSGGVAVLGDEMELKPLGWSPKDAEFYQQRKSSREAVLAAEGVPPARVQLPTANYAQSESALEQYWTALIGTAALFDEAFSRVARMFAGSSSVRVYHDFSGVKWLTLDRTERLLRVDKWVSLGVPLAQAAAYEGFDDLPVLLAEQTTGALDEAASAGTDGRALDSWWTEMQQRKHLREVGEVLSMPSAFADWWTAKETA